MKDITLHSQWLIHSSASSWILIFLSTASREGWMWRGNRYRMLRDQRFTSRLGHSLHFSRRLIKCSFHLTSNTLNKRADICCCKTLRRHWRQTGSNYFTCTEKRALMDSVAFFMISYETGNFLTDCKTTVLFNHLPLLNIFCSLLRKCRYVENTIGTIGTWASTAKWKAPFLNGRKSVSQCLVPSGNTNTLSYSNNTTTIQCHTKK